MTETDVLMDELTEISRSEIPITPEDLIVYVFRKLSENYDFKFCFNFPVSVFNEVSNKRTQEIILNLAVNFNGFVSDPFLSLISDLDYKIYFCFSGSAEGTSTATIFLNNLKIISNKIESFVFVNSSFKYKIKFDLKTFKVIENTKTQNIFHFKVYLKIIN